MSDLISRQALCKYALTQKDKVITPNEIMRFPSAEPKTKCIAQIRINREDIEDLVNEKVNEIVGKMSEIKTGKWVDDCACSICHWIHEDDNGFALITKYNYCPNCGAKIEETMNDSVSRQGISTWLYNMGYEKLSEYVLDEKRFPSKDRPIGKWIDREYCQVDEDVYEVAICSECGAEITIEYPYDNYCPNCGTKMEL